ncbi:hypothetical protein CW304_18450 [Bacillus sp. UFRGS-B20]|nr:hypothetical protein CW304_18450 [Bacillus sp. UFRGS-B20]
MVIDPHDSVSKPQFREINNLLLIQVLFNIVKNFLLFIFLKIEYRNERINKILNLLLEVKTKRY